MLRRENPGQRGGIRLFEHPLLEWSSRVHPALPVLFWGPVVVACLWYGVSLGVRGWTIVGAVTSGYLSWLLSEYALHRWFFHFRPQALWLRRWMYYVHEHHHRYQEWDRLVAPPLLSFSIAAVALMVIYASVGRLVGLPFMCVFLSGYFAAYLVYDYTHLYLHFARPRTRWGRFVRRCHLEHHFVRPDRWFCISFPPLDYLFGTHRRRNEPPIPEGSHPGDWNLDEELAIPLIIRQQEANRNSAPGPDARPHVESSSVC